MIIRTYHFVSDKLRDGRPVPPDGEWLVHDGELVMCQSGLHASRHPFDALAYAPGPILCLVDCDEIDAEDVDKLVCRRRRIVARFDATTMLRAFARQCALDVIHLWDAPQVVRDYLTTGDDSIRAAAWNAAWAAVYAARAASYAARAASYAAGAAAYAARAAVYATRDASYAARDAASAAAPSEIELEFASVTGRYYAMDAARAAAKAAQRERFARLVADEFTNKENNDH